jgi:hypothetical protein
LTILKRGRALQSRDPSAKTFTWRDDAARAFRYVRQLQKHEESLIAELQRHATLVNALTDPESPHPLAEVLGKRVVELRTAPEPLTADAAAAGQREVLDRYAAAVSDSFTARLAELGTYGFVFEEVARGVGGSLHLVKPKSGDPRLRPSMPRGGVLLALGETETLATDVWSFIKPTASNLAPLDRAALVHVIHATDNVSAELENRRAQWNDYLNKQSEGIPDFRFAVDVVPLIDVDKNPDINPVQLTAASLAGFGAWARPERRSYPWISHEIPSLVEALEKWKATNTSVFQISIPYKEPGRPFEEQDILENHGAVLLNIYANYPKPLTAEVAYSCMVSGFDNADGNPEQWEPLGKWLVRTARVILYIDWTASPEWESKDLMEAINAGARVILVKPDPLLEAVKDPDVSYVRAPLPTGTDSEAKQSDAGQYQGME